MINTVFNLQLLCASLIMLSIILMHIVKKNSTLVTAYILQSLGLVVLLGSGAIQEKSFGLLVVTAIMFVIKIIVAPSLFIRLIKKSHLNLSASTYLNIPLTLSILLGILVFSQSDILTPLLTLLPVIPQIKTILISGILMSLFLIINRKGALSQIIGVLSLENTIFVFGIFLGVRQLSALEIGLLFDVFFWIVVSSVFVTMIYRNFGSFDISKLNQLKK
ncbi:MAG TPA: hypothetical protein VFQ63_03145 [Patescibacteria group bacterium]|nr:hypothetical protein [Patescibacteria group bacterium]